MRPQTTQQQNNYGADSSRAAPQESTNEQPSPPSPGSPGDYPLPDPDTDEATHEHWLLFEAWRVGLG